MIRHFDHVAIVVRDIDAATAFFALLGFAHDRSGVISGHPFAAYMGMNEIEAEHVTLVLPHSAPRLEVQLLKYHRPEVLLDANITKLNHIGFNHICFAVDDIDAQVQALRHGGATLHNSMMEFHDRKIVFVDGPEGITVELAQWQSPRLT